MYSMYIHKGKLDLPSSDNRLFHRHSNLPSKHHKQTYSSRELSYREAPVSTVLIQGVCQAGAIITGQTLGKGRKEQAEEQGWLFLGMGFALGFLSALFIFFTKTPVIQSYGKETTAEAVSIAYQLLNAISLIIIFQATNSIMTKGVLRGGGDTKVLMFADNIFLWAMALPLGILAGFVFELPAFWIYFFLKSDQIAKIDNIDSLCEDASYSKEYIHDVTKKVGTKVFEATCRRVSAEVLSVTPSGDEAVAKVKLTFCDPENVIEMAGPNGFEDNIRLANYIDTAPSASKELSLVLRYKDGAWKIVTKSVGDIFKTVFGFLETDGLIAEPELPDTIAPAKSMSVYDAYWVDSFVQRNRKSDQRFPSSLHEHE